MKMIPIFVCLLSAFMTFAQKTEVKVEKKQVVTFVKQPGTSTTVTFTPVVKSNRSIDHSRLKKVHISMPFGDKPSVSSVSYEPVQGKQSSMRHELKRIEIQMQPTLTEVKPTNPPRFILNDSIPED